MGNPKIVVLSVKDLSLELQDQYPENIQNFEVIVS